MIWLLAATATTTPAPQPSTGFDITELLQYGLLGLIFLCMIFRKFIVPEWVLKSAEERHEVEKQDLLRQLAEKRDQVAKLQDVFQVQMIPALTRATEVNARYIEEMQINRYRKPPDDQPKQIQG